MHLHSLEIVEPQRTHKLEQKFSLSSSVLCLRFPTGVVDHHLRVLLIRILRISAVLVPKAQLGH